MRSAVSVGLLLIFVPLCRTTALADVHPLVLLEIDTCVDAPGNEVRRLIAIELGAVLADSAEATTDRTRVAVLCVGSLLELRVNDPITGKSLQRTIDLQEAPRARPRLLALAIVELISASWTELETNPQPKVYPAGPRASPESRHAALQTVIKQSERSALRRLRLLAIGGGMTFFSGPGFLGGGGLRLAQDYPRHIGWMADVQEHHGNATVSLGSVSVDTLSLGAAFVVHHAWPKIGLHLGAGLRGGAVRLSGKPNVMQTVQGSNGWAPWVGPMGLISLTVAATRRLVFDIGIESGYVVSPVGGLVDVVRELAVDGPWIGFQVGVGIFL